MSDYDVIVVGSGAGGGVAAGVLAEAGKRVLVLERGQDLSFAEIGRDHLRNHRLARYGHNTGPELHGNPRTFVDPLGDVHLVRPHEGGYNNNAMTVGGGTRVFGAQAWRFLPEDFRMAQLYGVPEGSSLADWPITYDDLAPYYERAEWELGVAGDDGQHEGRWPRRKPYPMPPMPVNNQGTVLREGARRLGWETRPVPLLINTVPYGGRGVCIRCQHCVGFACPTDAKNGSQNTMLPRALATGNSELITGAMVTRIDVDGGGRVTGVTYIGPAGDEQQARAEVVICAGGAIETARLLLHSRSAHHPDGLGNQHDMVGRNLQGHYYPGAAGLMPEPIWDGLGPGPSTATCRFNHGNADVIGGGMLADEFVVLPIIFVKRMMMPDVPRWGKANKDFMRHAYGRSIHVMGPVHEIPSPDCRVTLDPDVRDRWGMPVARLSGTSHPETVRTSAYMGVRAREWLIASGAQQIWSRKPTLVLSGGQHQAGTCRMGDDPETSVVDRWGKVHGHDNLYVADGSMHVTNGGFNPVLTIMALSFRTAEHIAESW
jgi:choline dehydrogenase-like flavoprotein